MTQIESKRSKEEKKDRKNERFNDEYEQFLENFFDRTPRRRPEGDPLTGYHVCILGEEFGQVVYKEFKGDDNTETNTDSLTRFIDFNNTFDDLLDRFPTLKDGRDVIDDEWSVSPVVDTWLQNMQQLMFTRIDINDNWQETRDTKKAMKEFMGAGQRFDLKDFNDYYTKNILKAMYEFGDGAKSFLVESDTENWNTTLLFDELVP